MASLGEESLNSLASAQLAAIEQERQQLLLEYGQIKDDAPSAPQQNGEQAVHPTADYSHDDAPGVRPLTIADSLDRYRTLPRPSSSNKRPRLSSSNSAPADGMEAMVQPTTSPRAFNGMAKAASFAGGIGDYSHGGDTQPVDSQVYHQYTAMESMRDEARGSTPHKQQSTNGTSPETGPTDLDHTPRTLQPGQVGYVDLDGIFQARETSPATSWAGYDELLAADGAKSPDTQFYLPAKPTLPETPALAGQKHGRDGEPLTSVTTVTKFSQLLPQGAVMGATQLFAQTQEPSSPLVDGPHSDDAMARPSPNINGAMSSPRTMLSSPVETRHIRSSSGPGEPRAEYISMKESQERRERRMRAQLELEAAGDDVESESDEDTQQRRFRAKQLRRSKSDLALKEAARVRAPRPGAVSLPPSSTRKSVVDLITPATTRRRVNFDDILEDAEEEQIAVELPEEQSNDNQDEHSAQASDNDDQYDELQEKVIRSQSNFQDDEDDNASFVGSIQENGVEVPSHDTPLEDTQEPDDTETVVEEDDLQDPHEGVHNTQRSTIADSQNSVQARAVNHILSPHAQSSMASFVPGSQYIGKTSQDQAFLKLSHPSQSRVAASQVNDVQKVPSSPPLPRAVVDTADHSAEPLPPHEETLQASRTRHMSTQDDSATPQEIPDSDVPEDPAQELQHGNHVNVVGDEESNGHVPFSTAQTHVSASARSPMKTYVAPSPMKAFRSQQNDTPRKAFSDIIGEPKASNASFDINDVDDIMAGVITKEDEEVLDVISSPSSPMSKRRRTAHSNPRSSRLHSGSSGPSRTHEAQYTASETNATIQDSEPDFVRPAFPAKAHSAKRSQVEAVPESIATSEMEGTIPESEPEILPADTREAVLRDSPNKANVLPGTPLQESEKARTPTSHDTKQREDAGSRHVAQLISSTRASAPIVSKKGKLKTPTKAARQKSSKSRNSSRATSHNADTDVGDEVRGSNSEAPDVGEQAAVVDEINRTNSTPPPAERVHQADAEHVIPHVGDPLRDAVTGQSGNENTLAAPERVWALFKGMPQNFYPATWIGGSADGKTYKIRFDDKNVTNIDTHQVRALELRIGDQVKFDNGRGSRGKTWRISGFGAVARNQQDRETGVDAHGHSHVQVSAISSRNSIAKDSGASEDASETHEVLVSDLYLTSGMWKNYKDRDFSPPAAARPTAPTTPSSRAQTPEGDSPSSRARRSGPPNAKSRKKLGSSHLRDASVASSMSAGPGALFSGMAFAVTYDSNNAEKDSVTRAIQRNGGIIIEDGFQELFDIPDIGEPVATPSKKSPAKETENASRELGLQLKPKYKDYGFVALITDHYNRKVKYMQALALGLPTLSGRWILDSLNEERNPALGSGEVVPLPWGKYLLPAGESSYLGGAVRSRTMLPYDAATTELRVNIQTRPLLLNDEGVLIVAPKRDKVAWEKRKTYAFLTLALGAGQVERVNDIQDAKSMVEADPHIWKWVYVDGDVHEAFSKLCGKGKKRKRVSEVALGGGASMLMKDGNGLAVVNDEFVVQSLVLGALAD